MTERSLDSEGMPDLEGPRPGTVITGDPGERRSAEEAAMHVFDEP